MAFAVGTLVVAWSVTQHGESPPSPQRSQQSADVVPAPHAASDPHPASPAKPATTTPLSAASGPLHVRVRAIDGSPVPGASIDLYRLLEFGRSVEYETAASEHAEPRMHASTSPDGAATIERCEGGRWLVAASAPGRARVFVTFDRTNRAVGPSDVELRLPPAAVLSGHVLDETGAGVRDARIVALPPDARTTPPGPATRHEVRSDATGAYSFGDLAPGPYQLWYEARGVPLVFAATVLVPDVGRFDVHTLRGGQLRGTVTDETTKAPVPGARVQFFRFALHVPIAEGVTDAAGRYEAWTGRASTQFDEVVLLNCGYVVATPPEEEHDAFRGMPHGVIAAGETQTFDIRARAAVSLAGRVTDAGGPVEGASVRLQRPTANAEREEAASYEMSTDADGRYRFTSVHPGPVTVTVSAYSLAAPGVEASFVRSAFPEHGETSVDIVLAPSDGPLDELSTGSEAKAPPILRGVVRGAGGKPVAFARVEVFEFDPNVEGKPRLVYAEASTVLTTDDEGRFASDLKPWRPEHFLLHVQAAGFAPAWSVPLRLTDDHVEPSADMTLDAGATVDARIVSLGTTRGVAGVGVVLERRLPWQSGSPVNVQADDDETPGLPLRALSDGEGRIRIEHLAAGDYDVCLKGGGIVKRFAELHVPSPTSLVFEVQTSAVIRGRVVLADGSPAPLAVVMLQSTVDGSYVKDAKGQPVGAWSDDNGAFRIDNAPSGTYRLFVDHTYAGATGTIARITEPVEAGSGDVTIVVQPGRTLKGRVLTMDGQPIGDATIECHTEAKDGLSNSAASSDADGTFVVGGLDATPHTVVVRAPGFLAAKSTGAVAGGEPPSCQHR